MIQIEIGRRGSPTYPTIKTCPSDDFGLESEHQLGNIWKLRLESLVAPMRRLMLKLLGMLLMMGIPVLIGWRDVYAQG